MTVMLCRNKVVNFDKWKMVFDSHTSAQHDSGLRLTNMWRDMDDPNNVFFIFEVSDIDKAKAFINNPTAIEAGQISGVLDGECHFLQNGEALD
jgi:hypothetical protein